MSWYKVGFLSVCNCLLFEYVDALENEIINVGGVFASGFLIQTVVVQGVDEYAKFKLAELDAADESVVFHMIYLPF